MNITALETIRIDEFPNICFVQIHTSEGIVGLGETYLGAEAVESWIHETASHVLLNENPLNIEKIWQALGGFLGTKSTGVESRGRSAIDIALWDIMGQYVKQPIYQLLGGACRDSIPIYNTCAGYRYTKGRPKSGGLPVDNWGLGDNEGPYEDLHAFLYHADELANSLVEQGYMGMKIWPFDPYAEKSKGRYISLEDLKKALEPFEKIRRAVGDKIEIMVELHALWDLPSAKRIAHALKDYRPFWYEDPLRPDSVNALSEFARFSQVPVAASETLGSRWAYLDILQQKAADIVIFDPTWTGGISESRRIATLVESFGRPVTAHDCVGPVSLITDVHLGIHLSNYFVQESVRAFYTSWYPQLVTELPLIENGRIFPLVGYGLGTSLRSEVFKRQDVTVRRTR